MDIVEALSYIGLGATKDEKIAVSQELWTTHLTRPRQVVFQPKRDDTQPIHAALDLSILAGCEVDRDPAVLQPLVSDSVGTVVICCDKSGPDSAIGGRRRTLDINKAIVPIGRVRLCLQLALYEVDYWNLRTSLRRDYDGTCPQDGSHPHHRYAREMDILLTGGVAAFNRILLRRERADADRFSILFERAMKRGWINLDKH